MRWVLLKNNLAAAGAVGILLIYTGLFFWYFGFFPGIFLCGLAIFRAWAKA